VGHNFNIDLYNRELEVKTSPNDVIKDFTLHTYKGKSTKITDIWVQNTRNISSL